MTKDLFVATYVKDALISEKQTGISADAQMAQAVIESKWGESAPNFMLFGIKDTDGINGNEQLIDTTEFSKIYTSDPRVVGLASITSVEPVIIHGIKTFKYKGKAYFRAYKSASESFIDHANFFLTNKRYAHALTDKADPYKFSDDIIAAGYGSGPDYAKLLKEIITELKPLINKYR